MNQKNQRGRPVSGYMLLLFFAFALQAAHSAKEREPEDSAAPPPVSKNIPPAQKAIRQQNSPLPPPMPPPIPSTRSLMEALESPAAPAANSHSTGGIGLINIEKPSDGPLLSLPKSKKASSPTLGAASGLPEKSSTALPYSFAELRTLLLQKGKIKRERVLPQVLIGHFPCSYPSPDQGKRLGITLDYAPSPLDPSHFFLRIGIRAAGTCPKSRDWVFILGDTLAPQTDIANFRNLLEWLIPRIPSEDHVSILRPGITGKNLATLHARRHPTEMSPLYVPPQNQFDLDVALQKSLTLLPVPERAQLVILTEAEKPIPPPARETILNLHDFIARGAQLTVLSLRSALEERILKEMKEPAFLRRCGGRCLVVPPDRDSWETLLGGRFPASAPVAALQVHVSLQFEPNSKMFYRPLHRADAAWQQSDTSPMETGLQLPRLTPGESKTALYELRTAQDTLSTLPLGLEVSLINPLTRRREIIQAGAGQAKRYPSVTLAPPAFRRVIIAGELALILRGAEAQHYPRLKRLVKHFSATLPPSDQPASRLIPPPLERMLQ